MRPADAAHGASVSAPEEKPVPVTSSGSLDRLEVRFYAVCPWPNCDHREEFEYDKFTNDWGEEEISCEGCKRKIKVQHTIDVDLTLTATPCENGWHMETGILHPKEKCPDCGEERVDDTADLFARPA